MRLWSYALICLLLLTVLLPQADVQNKKRIVVGFYDEGSLADLLRIPGVEKLKVIPEIKAAVLAAPEEAIQKIRGIKGIKYVEIDHIARALELSDYQDVLWNVKIINASKVWDYYYPEIGWSSLGKGIRVAVLDTGIDYTHPELVGKVSWCAYTVGTKTYTGTKLSNCADKNGHGTHVSGIIASTINNVGNAGVAPNVTLYAVKVLNNAGYGTYSDIAEGIILAVKGPDGSVGTEDDAKILSMSLGGSSDSSVLHDAVIWAYNNGAIIVAAAGNEGDGDPSTDNVAYPARYSEVIAVAAVDSSYNVPSWSSDGPEVDVAAPGVSIYSTYKNSGYATLSGTSMATPHVSATVALMQAVRVAYGKNPLSFAQVYEALTKTAVDIGSPGFDVFSGYGLVDAYSAVQYALKQP